MADLDTVALNGVEILAADVTIHGRGSPPEGDRYTTEDLRAMADAHRELQSELKPAAWIGHSRDQPAVGHLENLRVSGDGKRLLADVANVPKRFAELLNSKAYNSRSVELSRVTSQLTGRTHDKVVSGLAWLGAKLPAVGVLADVTALYETASVELQRAYSLDDGGRDGNQNLLIDHAINTGRIVEADRAAWARALDQDDDAIRQLAQIPPNTAVDEETYNRDFAARSAGARPFFAQDDREASRRELNADDIDPESAEIATRLGIDPRSVV